jgi:hypothetical protein
MQTALILKIHAESVNEQFAEYSSFCRLLLNLSYDAKTIAPRSRTILQEIIMPFRDVLSI